MKHYQYLIIGGGLAGDAAVRGIRELDPAGSVGMISKESDPPYARPNLSKALWRGRPVGKIWRNTRELGVDLYLERTVTDLDPSRKSLCDNTGEEYSYEKLLLATGGSPVRLPFGDDHIIYYRDFQDYHRLRMATEHGEQFLIIGGGFIGSEIAAALTMIGKKVILVFPEPTLGARIFPPDLAGFVSNYYREKGVEFVPEDVVSGMEEAGQRFTVHTRAGRSFDVDGVIAGIGIRPNLALARRAGLNVEDGIIVDEHLRTSAPDVFAAGDVANFFHAALGKRVRVEHEDNALHMGKLAGRNMAGAQESYTHVPMFYSDLFDLGYEAVGELNSKMAMVADWQEPFRKGVVYYLEEGRVRGVLLWNLWSQLPQARALLQASGPFRAADLVGRLSGKNGGPASLELLEKANEQ
jgi:3-phenylpropionate/trans-cinnamate dioxygenase ferredoxin reductase subunit